MKISHQWTHDVNVAGSSSAGPQHHMPSWMQIVKNVIFCVPEEHKGKQVHAVKQPLKPIHIVSVGDDAGKSGGDCEGGEGGGEGSSKGNEPHLQAPLEEGGAGEENAARAGGASAHPSAVMSAAADSCARCGEHFETTSGGVAAHGCGCKICWTCKSSDGEDQTRTGCSSIPSK